MELNLPTPLGTPASPRDLEGMLMPMMSAIFLIALAKLLLVMMFHLSLHAFINRVRGANQMSHLLMKIKQLHLHLMMTKHSLPMLLNANLYLLAMSNVYFHPMPTMQGHQVKRKVVFSLR
jgi:hypothetical protein